MVIPFVAFGGLGEFEKGISLVMPEAFTEFPLDQLAHLVVDHDTRPREDQVDQSPELVVTFPIEGIGIEPTSGGAEAIGTIFDVGPDGHLVVFSILSGESGAILCGVGLSEGVIVLVEDSLVPVRSRWMTWAVTGKEAAVSEGEAPVGPIRESIEDDLGNPFQHLLVLQEHVGTLPSFVPERGCPRFRGAPRSMAGGVRCGAY